MSKKINKEELKEVQDLNSKINSITTSIGVLEYQKAILMGQLVDVNNEMEVKKKQLQKEYGDVSIDIKDGSIKNSKNESNT
jgi:hypothetical protein|tara:strand:+ start:664 stop:906 length:243 start_codon:yes stop_codon:yes gene_type:complete